MTISSTTNRVPYDCNGVTVDFPITFPFHAQADLVVVETIIATGVQTTKALSTHYTISGTTDSLGHYSNGGTITAVTAPPATVRWTVYRDPVRTQELNLTENNSLPAESLEAALDYQNMLIQRVADLIGRSLRQPDGDSANIATMPSKVDRASKYSAFDANGDPVCMAGTSETPNALLKTGGTMTGGINEAKTTVASATTPDIFAVTVGGYIDYTGTTTCTGFVAAPQAGAVREIRCSGAAPFTAGANMLIDGYASGETFTATADDRIIVRAETTTQFRLTIRKRNAKSINASLPFAVAGGSADAITANFSPDLVLADEPIFALVMAYANGTTTPTLATDGGTARTVVKKGGSALAIGDIPGALAVCLFKYNSANTRYELLNPGALSESYVYVREEQAANTQGGTFTSGAWRTRTLNTEVSDAGAVCTLASNQITLSAGTYRFRAIAPANAVDTHKARLQNVTDATTIELGSSMAARATGPTDNHSVIVGRFTIAASKALEVQHYCGTTRATDGFGVAANVGVTEVYTMIEFWKEA